MEQSSGGPTLADLGEEGLIARVAVTAALRPDVLAGIGDDCAVLREPDGSALVVTCDALVEGVHFRRDWSPARSIGHKALAVNLSDVAAMGATPVAAFLTFSAPADLPVAWVDDFLTGLRALAALHRVDLLGGDTTGSPGPLALSLTVLGRAPVACVRYRRGARPGDRLVVTGCLGDAGAALGALLAGRACAPELRRALEWPTPRVAAGQAFGRMSGCTALMDLSDGLGTDLPRLLKASGVGARLDVERLPVSPALLAECQGDRRAAARIALRGGDDYELLAAVARDVPLPDLEGLALTVVGEVVGVRGVTWCDASGRALDPPLAGYDHFGAGA
jgi:thiamine-monophosphate kinase